MKKKDSTQENLKAFEQGLTKAELLLEKNQNKLIVIVSSFVVLFSLFFAFKKFYKEPREMRAVNEIYLAERAFEKNNYDEALNGNEEFPGFFEIIELYSDTKIGNLSNYYSGICYFKLNEPEKSIEFLENFKSNDEILISIANGVIGDSFSELNQNEDALDYYIKASKLNNNNFTTPIYLMKAGKIAQLLSDYNKALSLYSKIKKDYPNSKEAQNIDKYITMIKSKI